jgi:hypothetical protein
MRSNSFVWHALNPTLTPLCRCKDMPLTQMDIHATNTQHQTLNPATNSHSSSFFSAFSLISYPLDT